MAWWSSSAFRRPSVKKRPKSKAQTARPLSHRYAAALRSYLNGSGEAGLRQAYEVGRSALSAGSGVLDMAQIHLSAQRDVMRRASTLRESQQILKAAGEICLESFSPYEMAHRGFREANAALRHLNELLEQEAHRLARELHDEAGQLLAAVHLALDEATHDLPAPHTQRLDRVKELLVQIEGHLRRISHELRPLVLDDLGLGPAIRFLADGVSKRSGLTILAEDLAEERFPSHVELALYRIVQESLNNAVKHSRARSVRIETLRQEHSVVCTIRDDGKGFDSAAVIVGRGRRGLGLSGMRERANSLGGTLEIKSLSGKGTLISVRLPLGS
jgi:signal transduction histidine kinase